MLKPINILKYYLFGTFTMTFYIQLLEFSLPFWSTHTACNVRISISQLHCKHRLEHCPALKCISFTTGSYQVPDRVSITSPLFFYFVSSYIVPSLAIYNRKTVKNSLTKIITSIPTKVWSYSPTLNGTGFNVHQIGKYSSFFIIQPSSSHPQCKLSKHTISIWPKYTQKNIQCHIFTY